MKSKIISLLLIVTFVNLFVSCQKKEKKISADLVLTNGKIVTIEDNYPQAEAVAIKGDTIMAVGKKADINQLVGDSTMVVDLKGKLALPGFIESHAHFTGYGKSQQILKLRNAKNWDDIIFMVAEAAEISNPGDWILGRGWHQDKWTPKVEENIEGFPVHRLLSEVAPYNPVMLNHASGHAIIANKKAMEIAGVDKNTKDPAGGEIVRDAQGNLTGVFKETAESLIGSKFQKYLAKKSKIEKKKYFAEQMKLADKKCIEFGITTLHDAGTSFEKINIMKELFEKGELNVRLNVMIGESNKAIKENIKNYKLKGYANNKLSVFAIKRFIDGALGAGSAWMLKNYSDNPGNFGIQTIPLKEIRETAKIALENGLQVATHAIGDKANRTVLDIYEEFYNKSENKNLRWRIEHAQHLSKKDIPRFAKIGVIPAMQTIHCTSDAPYVINRLGKKRAEEGAYVWRKLLNSGVKIPNGTDAPIEDIAPMPNFYAAVTRISTDGKPFYPAQKMTRMEALKSYTIYGAMAAFEEKIKGTLKKGKLADITVLSKDILTIPENEILSVKTVYTIIGGKIVYKDDK